MREHSIKAVSPPPSLLHTDGGQTETSISVRWVKPEQESLNESRRNGNVVIRTATLSIIHDPEVQCRRPFIAFCGYLWPNEKKDVKRNSVKLGRVRRRGRGRRQYVQRAGGQRSGANEEPQ